MYNIERYDYGNDIVCYEIREKEFHICVYSVHALAEVVIHGDPEDKIVLDPVFYYDFLRRKYYDFNAYDLFEKYPDLTFGEFNEVLRLAVVEYIRSLFPESIRGGILS